ncbi:hypothetical protein JOB18_024392 [Solea senegalensis]|uniref:Uncharacterized protein n=1 Tax=Solea senegalensis TaxID=28829 RepID=A0AAV6QMA7_SOLSE|nr:hypothetical protein JOB18_024392 [Solea senegalensis]KAG7494150.1 hypothetical protein JOB18_024392 [Solea senegalensis]
MYNVKCTWILARLMASDTAGPVGAEHQTCLEKWDNVCLTATHLQIIIQKASPITTLPSSNKTDQRELLMNC